MNIKYVIKQCYRGTHYLPEVGDHPGTTMLIGWIILGLVASINKPLEFIVVANAINFLFIFPIYLFGAYDRAVLSDRIVKSKQS